MTRETLIPAVAGFLAGLPVIVLATLLDWPAVSFFGAMLVAGAVFIALFDRAERRAGR
jgi:hypothetical protein